MHFYCKSSERYDQRDSFKSDLKPRTQLSACFHSLLCTVAVYRCWGNGLIELYAVECTLAIDEAILVAKSELLGMSCTLWGSSIRSVSTMTRDF